MSPRAKNAAISKGTAARKAKYDPQVFNKIAASGGAMNSVMSVVTWMKKNAWILLQYISLRFIKGHASGALTWSLLRQRPRRWP